MSLSHVKLLFILYVTRVYLIYYTTHFRLIFFQADLHLLRLHLFEIDQSARRD